MVINALFRLFQEVTSQFTVVIVLDNTSQMILVETDHQETTEVQEISETILDQVEEKVINS